MPSPTPPPAPPKGGKSGSGKRTPLKSQQVVEPGKLVAPIDIPEEIPDEELDGCGDRVGVPWGVDYGDEKNVWNETFERLVAVAVAKEEEPVRAIGEVRLPRLLRRVEPDYPQVAREARVEGVVILEATTDIYGRVQSVKVLRSVPLLDQAAVEAVKQWVYEPMVINGRPRAVVFTVTITFRLKK
jgi:protein TonB